MKKYIIPITTLLAVSAVAIVCASVRMESINKPTETGDGSGAR